MWVCGLLVNSTEPDEIADAVVHLLGNQEEAEEMGKRGRKVVVERYNWERRREKATGIIGGFVTIMMERLFTLLT